jgi:hypothetical protein
MRLLHGHGLVDVERNLVLLGLRKLRGLVRLRDDLRELRLQHALELFELFIGELAPGLARGAPE